MASITIKYTDSAGAEHEGSVWSDGPEPATKWVVTLEPTIGRRYILIKMPTPKQAAAGIKPYVADGGPPRKAARPTRRK